MTNKNFSVNDIVFVFLKKGENALIPIRIVEKITKETFGKIDTTLVVKAPSGETYNLDPRKERIYFTLPEAKDDLTQHALREVTKVIEVAYDLCNRYFENEQPDQTDTIHIQVEDE